MDLLAAVSPVTHSSSTLPSNTKPPMASTRRLSALAAHLSSPLTVAPVADEEAYKAALIDCRAALAAFIDKMNANPIFVRLAWHDSGTYDKEVRAMNRRRSRPRNSLATAPVYLPPAIPRPQQGARWNCTRIYLRGLSHPSLRARRALPRALTPSPIFPSQISEFPACGGANGSIRFEPEINHGANAGLSKAVNYLKRFKKDFPILS